MKTPKLTTLSPIELANLIKKVISRSQFPVLHDIFDKMQNEIKEILTAQKLISEVKEKTPYLAEAAKIYKQITPLIRQALNNDHTLTKLTYDGLLCLSLLYAGEMKDCYCPGHQYFVSRNIKNHPFWQWFLAHLPYQSKLMTFPRFDFNHTMVIPSILISSPYDLQYYKVFCREIKRVAPEFYKEISIEPDVCKEVLKRLRMKEEGITPPRQAYPAHLAKNNILLLDILR